jgi:DNA-binding protein WhiA
VSFPRRGAARRAAEASRRPLLLPRAYLRGALLGAGSLSGPRDPHLEVRASTVEAARFIADVAAREDVHVRRRAAQPRGRLCEGHEAIGDLLVVAGAVDTALRLEEHAVVSATCASANRLANADEANLVRTARAAHEQLEAIRALDVGSLPAPLAEIAELRLRHPRPLARARREACGRRSRRPPRIGGCAPSSPVRIEPDL